MAKIFFACSMRGGFGQLDQAELEKIPVLIESLGHSLMSNHQSGKDAVAKDNQFTPLSIFERDYNWIKECDAMIAEISNPSLGVGAEIAFASSLDKPVLCVYNSTIPAEKISAFIRGMDGSEFSKTVRCTKYGDLGELKKLMGSFII